MVREARRFVATGTGRRAGTAWRSTAGRFGSLEPGLAGQCGGNAVAAGGGFGDGFRRARRHAALGYGVFGRRLHWYGRRGRAAPTSGQRRSRGLCRLLALQHAGEYLGGCASGAFAGMAPVFAVAVSRAGAAVGCGGRGRMAFLATPRREHGYPARYAPGGLAGGAGRASGFRGATGCRPLRQSKCPRRDGFGEARPWRPGRPGRLAAGGAVCRHCALWRAVRRGWPAVSRRRAPSVCPLVASVQRCRPCHLPFRPRRHGRRAG